MTLAALNEAVRVEQLLDDAGLARALTLIRRHAAVARLMIEAVVVVHHVPTAAHRQAVHQAQGRRVEVEPVVHVVSGSARSEHFSSIAENRIVARRQRINRECSDGEIVVIVIIIVGVVGDQTWCRRSRRKRPNMLISKVREQVS